VPLPTTLGGTRIVVRDSAGVERYSPLFFTSPGQINYLIPSGTAIGTAGMAITSGAGEVSIGTVDVQQVAPALFSANASGKDVAAGYALRFGSTGAQSTLTINNFDSVQKLFLPVPLDLGTSADQTFLILFGTGLRFRSSLNNVSATIGGVAAQVAYAGPQGTFVGLDQINLAVPRSLIGRGEVPVVLTVDGKITNNVTVQIK
jgi:uncharacterized protein (TIGR03437 family)